MENAKLKPEERIELLEKLVQNQYEVIQTLESRIFDIENRVEILDPKIETVRRDEPLPPTKNLAQILNENPELSKHLYPTADQATGFKQGFPTL